MPEVWIWTTHPNVKLPVRITRNSFEQLYRKKGWVETDEPEKTEAQVKAETPKEQPPRFPVEEFDEGKPREFKTKKSSTKPAKKPAVKKAAAKK